MTNEELEFRDKVALEVVKGVIASEFFVASMEIGPEATIKGLPAFAYGLANEMIIARKEMT